LESINSPRLGHLLNSTLLSKYLVFLHARGCRQQTLAVVLNAASRVCEWMHSTGQLTPLDVMHMDDFKAWLTTMLKGVNSLPALHKTASTHPDDILQEASRNVSPEHLMALLHGALDKALKLLPLIDKQDFTACVDACQIAACLLVGGCQLPPIRPSVVMSLLRPDYGGECATSYLLPNLQLLQQRRSANCNAFSQLTITGLKFVIRKSKMHAQTHYDGNVISLLQLMYEVPAVTVHVAPQHCHAVLECT
jgi:hypothetical protein